MPKTKSTINDRDLKRYSKKREIISIRFNAEQLRVVKNKANRMNLERSTYIREASVYFNEDLSPLISLRTSRELRKIGININQMARRLNAIHVNNKVLNFKDVEALLTESIILIKKALNKINLEEK